jgi:hypothetical protein
MAYRDTPDMAMPPDDQRCEALTRPVPNTFQVWRRSPHRCVRRAVQGRDGRAVCACHARMRDPTYWGGEPDQFAWSVRLSGETAMRGDRRNYGRGEQMTRLELRLTREEMLVLLAESTGGESPQDTVRRLIREYAR